MSVICDYLLFSPNIIVIFLYVDKALFWSYAMKVKQHFDLYLPQAGLHVFESQPTPVQWPSIKGNQ